jgi:hypothetical protein
MKHDGAHLIEQFRRLATDASIDGLICLTELLIDLIIRRLIDSYNDNIVSLLHITFKGPFLI